MKYKVVKNDRSIDEQYFIMRKKNFFTRWKFLRNELGLISFWRSEKSAQKYVEQLIKNNQ